MAALKPRQLRFAALVLVLLALFLALAHLTTTSSALWRARDHVTAVFFLDDTEPGAAPQVLQHLLVAKPPAAFPAPSVRDAPLLGLHIFSTGSVAGYMRRQLIRRHSPLARLPEEYRALVQVRFVLGQQPAKTELIWSPPDHLAAEQVEHGDLLLLDEEENMNDGKSIAWMQAVGRGPASQWVFKADDDTLVHLPNVLDEVLRYSPQKPTYVGTSVGRSTQEQIYFTGALYGFSWPVLASVGAANLTEEEVRMSRFEDVRIGEVMHSLPSAPGSPDLRAQFPCLPMCEGEDLDQLQSLAAQLNRHDVAVRTNPRTQLRYVNVLTRIANWRQSLWPWEAGARTALAWHRLKSDQDYVTAYKAADSIWQPPRWFKKELEELGKA